jgi:hypothetical protein
MYAMCIFIVREFEEVRGVRQRKKGDEDWVVNRGGRDGEADSFYEGQPETPNDWWGDHPTPPCDSYSNHQDGGIDDSAVLRSRTAHRPRPWPASAGVCVTGPRLILYDTYHF